MNSPTFPPTPPGFKVRKLSEMLERAIHDVLICHADPRYVIDMSAWHSPEVTMDRRRVCHVCLAGAFMANSLGAAPERPLYPASWGGEMSAMLTALNDLRVGDAASAVAQWRGGNDLDAEEAARVNALGIKEAPVYDVIARLPAWGADTAAKLRQLDL